MLLVISPAKTQDFTPPPPDVPATQPAFLRESARLVKLLRALSSEDLAGLMGISGALAALNAGRFAQWHTPFTLNNAKQAVLAFNGDVYAGLDAKALDPGDLAFAQEHLRILSGLYGCLRPLDLIQPYRLEMRIRLASSRGTDLYAFWGDRLTRAMNQALAAGDGAPILVNLASTEYIKALDPAALAGRMVTPVFEDFQGAGYKVVGFYAKKARGLMVRFALRQRLLAPERLKDFQDGGYRFDPEVSTGDRWVFRRRSG